MNYAGPDKLVGTLLGTIGPTLLYWEDVKSVDVQRYVNSVVLSIEDERQEYIGFGRESFKDVEVRAVFYLLEQNPSGLTDEDTLEGYLQQVHDIVNQYDNSTQTDTVVGNAVVWVKVTGERRAEELRGIILYEVTFEVRIYLAPGAT